MFRELVRKNKMLSMEECIEILKTETRGVLSEIGDDELQFTPEHICGKIVTEA